MKSFIMGLDSARSYHEREIDAEISAWQRSVTPEIETDHVTVRRLLVDAGRLERTLDGSEYRVGFPAASVLFDLEVDEIDARATIAAYRDHEKRRRRSSPR